MFTIVDVFQNLTREKRAMLTDGEISVLLEYIQFWNNHGRKTNMIAPRNSAICNVHGISKKTFYKHRKGLVDKGFITVESRKFQPLKDGKHRHAQGQGRQKPAIVRLADWLIKSNKISVANEQKPQKTKEKDVPKIHRTTAKPISVAELEQYGKDLAVQIGATAPVYPKQLERIKGYENKTSKEVIKLVRSYVESHNNSNAWAYYQATLEDLVRNHVNTVTELEAYNPKLAGKTRYQQQELPMMEVVKDKKNKKNSKTKYVRGKRVEQGTDWKKKTEEEHLKNARKWLGLEAGQDFPADYQGLTVDEIYNKAYKDTNQDAELQKLQQFFEDIANKTNNNAVSV